MASTAVVDWFTNPTYGRMVEMIRAQWEKENAHLRAVGRGESEGKFQHQTGVCDGIERMLLLLNNERKKALEPGEDGS